MADSYPSRGFVHGFLDIEKGFGVVVVWVGACGVIEI
jgi:hypothetical protein